MTDQEFEGIAVDIERAASDAKVDLSDAASSYTVWLEDPIGSRSYRLSAKSSSRQNADALAENHMQATVYGVQGGKIQLIEWRNGRRVGEFSMPVRPE